MSDNAPTPKTVKSQKCVFIFAEQAESKLRLGCPRRVKFRGQNLICGYGGIGRRARFRFLWRQLCTGSSPATRTISSVHKGFELMNTLFVLSYNFHVRAMVTPCSFLCRELIGYILYGNTFACIRDDIRSARYFWYLHIPCKAIIDNDSLRSVFTFALCFKNINMVDEFTEQRCGQSVHSHKPADCRSEILAFLFALSAFGKLLTKRFNFCFQLQPFCFILVRQLHKPFITHFADSIILIKLFV